ncbi:GDSL-type esterase/lipase family protein [Salegentibacter maritimus]|uniref:GDSL-type esterase/lipase family protein n=1 Tax=Salegentibacter maritimus TaxID=2794347 RepID=UPI0018E43564|nr:GDSL-type esterase/lipase family protein [Salegentibacter maritimus]MBI6117852.1 hypothetical protein [Salegentibacter maritimus]
MKLVDYFLIFSFSLPLLAQAQAGLALPKEIKIACVGNSITYGATMENKERNAYPAQLQEMLGDRYVVENFGVSGHTLLKRGDRPYWKSDQYQKALQFKPDIVFILLGTNDSKSQNRKYLGDDFETDYKDLIASFKKRNTDVRTVLLLPLPSFSKDSVNIWNPVIKERIIPLIQKVAYKEEKEVIDLYQLFIDQQDLLPDGVHPSSLGATIIAKRLYEVVMQEQKKKTLDLKNEIGIELSYDSNFHGFAQTSFKFKGIDCKLARPRKAAKGAPWVLRARFWGHEPQTDIALLERGFHIAYCDVSNLFGNQEAVERWNVFYSLMTKVGFSKKVILEGMSRGGLILYNWAEQNPEKVAGIYADAPVFDGKSWPGGFGSGKGNAKDWERFKKAYGLKSDWEIKTFQGDPIHKIKSIAQGGYPIFHIVGETDNLVPIAENTIPFEDGVKKYGGNIKTIYKPNNGHHPHSLQNPTPIVNFIMSTNQQKVNFAIVPAPSAEYRSGAGWTEGSDWWTQVRDIDSLCKTSKDIDLLLLGNSITQGLGGNRSHVSYQPGKVVADEYFKDLKWINAGISGDRIEHLLWRLRNGNYEKADPKTVVLTIGVNNFPFNSAQEIVAGIKALLQQAKEMFPSSKIMLFGPLPTGTEKDSRQRKKYRKIHNGINKLSFNERTSYHEVSKLFKTGSGKLNPELYSEDGIHLKEKGYKVWIKYMNEKLD